MITGEFKNTIDEKGRLLVPAKIRSAIEGNYVILTRGIDQCLWMFPPSEWQKIAANLMNTTSPFHSKTRMIQRRIVAPAQEIEIDKSGRVNISPSLREHAGLKKDCIVLGIEKYIEIWDEEIYKQYWSEHEDEFQAASEELGDLVSF